MEQRIEAEIDLGRLMQILYARKKAVGTIVGGCMALAFGTNGGDELFRQYPRIKKSHLNQATILITVVYQTGRD